MNPQEVADGWQALYEDFLSIECSHLFTASPEISQDSARRLCLLAGELKSAIASSVYNPNRAAQVAKLEEVETSLLKFL